MPISQKTAANRANAKLSTGPRTAAGKNRSCQNALRHGLTGRMVLLPSEDAAAFLQFSNGILDSLRPETPAELQLAHTIADGHWRLNRILAVESGLFAMGGSEEVASGEPIPNEPSQQHSLMVKALNAANAFRDNTKAFITLSLYEQRLQRAVNVALKQLQQLQTERKEKSPYELTDAIRLYKFHEMKGLEWHPENDGFLYSNKEIQAERLRRQRRRLAEIAEEERFNLEKYQTRVA